MYPMFFLHLIVLGEILGLRYPIYLSFTLRCFQLLVQLVHCSRALTVLLLSLHPCLPSLFACLYSYLPY